MNDTVNAKMAKMSNGVQGKIKRNSAWVEEIKKSNNPPIIHQYEAVADLKVTSICYNPVNNQNIVGIEYIYLEWEDRTSGEDMILPLAEDVAIMVIGKNGYTQATYFAENIGHCRIPVKGIRGEAYIRILAIR